MPQQPVDALRAEMERKIAALSGPLKIAVFGCECAADAQRLESADTAVLNLICTGLLPPSFVEYALRSGADGVLVTGCREGSCAYRLGSQWTEQRLAGRREPHLRPTVPGERLCIVWADGHEMSDLKATLGNFRENLKDLGADAKRLHPYTPRRIVHHG
jgi:coenzyme F420-reducing hydrogenase delta subunit